MLNRRENPDALLELTEHELNHIEYCFLKEFTTVLEKHQYFYENHDFYKNLVEFYKFAKNQLKWKEEFTA